MGSSYIFPVRLSVTVRVSRWPSFLAGRACLCVCMLICSFYANERPVVLVVVEEYLPGPFVDGPLHRYVAVVRLHEVLPDRFAGGAHHIVVELPKDGHIHMKPRPARGLDEGRQGKRV